MPRLRTVIIGPSRGGFTTPRIVTPEVGSIEEALALAAREVAAEGAPAMPGDARGVAAFLNGADLRFNNPADHTVRAGDELTVIHPSTDT